MYFPKSKTYQQICYQQPQKMEPTQDEDFQAIRPYIVQNFQEYRILQPKMVFMHGLPQRFSRIEQLKYQLLNYGQIQNISVQFISKNFYSAFVEFETSIAASMTIAALDNFLTDKRTLRVSYASTKFCPKYLRGTPCMMQGCNYAHYYIGQMAHLKDFAKQINHYGIAINNLWRNYEEVLLSLCRFQENDSIFPSASVKLKEIFIKKNQQYSEYEKQIRKCLDILESKSKLIKSVSKIMKKRSKQSSGASHASFSSNASAEDDWSDLGSSICSFVQDTLNELSEEKEKSCASHKSRRKLTKIEQFLEEAEEKLMTLIFKASQMN